ncbi:MAG: cysteine--1-D-myo-inosityl 2-amino-2-deoxy-alpha-D-glucopyranoside ligase [Geodermatophilaceae bacterium]|nr:cysteine--1-D-myo-inosityl 2-amino-2-deoxy-alpha-D-glucopyranoside ligase [Geodermatophilaceae bacterium]
MRPWPAPAIPRLPGDGPALRLYDTATREVRPTTPRQTARMYVCGITPYDATHLGHAATYLAFDLVHRSWLDAGHGVHFVENVTDIDDPLLERAERDGDDWIVLAMRETALFREDMQALRVLPPRDYVGAVESIPAIGELVEKLLTAGQAYVLADGTGDIYQDIGQAGRFGYESGYDEPTMLRLSAERGGDPGRAGKRNPLDPLLWRGARESEPSWDGPGGPGRPGWHIECSSIILERLGDGIDVQGGGSDLVFPHHEMTAMHAETLTGAWPLARHYVHAGMIGLAGEKMSKSRGNLVFVSRLRGEGVDPMAIRLALLSGHYRADRAWAPDLLSTAQTRLAAWRQAVSLPTGPATDELLASLRRQLSDDLDTPHALASVDRWAAMAAHREGSDPDAPSQVSSIVDALLGVRL